ncbi:facilitated trehalose transporter Tret1-2 homolog isoform X3 [Colletes gigas]|uniref:facilitated trehalose transporter Tret1-2 homolog isoform X3 n=1 Tax=Colletes gigas TaxID=935657 RepID=UPI001C9A6127|nr:facilitated trehalose transporter Tret1-2 homolog isoform X3 [Colletes gigas]XP_043263389.1 facilitated trehalose transporter Tret1-2 homolog isoform X3 [Colletes gigas]
MNENSLGISQQTIISNARDEIVPAKRFLQYFASLSATLGALASGMVLGWTSSAGPDGINLQTVYNIPISADEFSWIGSLTALGSLSMSIPIGILTDLIGRKYSMLLMVVPFTVGWLLIILANTVPMFYIGRFITGISGGAFCVVAPMYTAEIAESSIRGSLGSYFQLLLTVGILLSYSLGIAMNMRYLSIVSAIMPLIFFCVFVFMPETPIYYLKKGNDQSARESLIKLRGVEYDVDNELQAQREVLEETRNRKISFLASLKSKAALKGFVIAYGLMFFQQFSGVNTVIFYASDIFEQTGADLEPSLSSIIVGAMQVIAVFVSTLIIDRLGRRILLLGSIIFMFLSSFTLGLYFYLVQVHVDVNSIKWLPLTAVCLFIIMFSLGFGPIPWMMVGEIFAPEVKGIAASSASLLNWLLVFIITKFYNDLKLSINISGTFWLFSGVCAVGIFFVYFLVPETKGKSLEEIQREFNDS